MRFCHRINTDEVFGTHKAVVALLGPDEFVGEGCLIGQLKRLATASAMTECEPGGQDRASTRASG
jgi:CRP-like cAMP-binding protein